MSTLTIDHHGRRRGASRADLLAGIACGAFVLGAAIPVLARNGLDSGEARSLSNLRTLAAAHEAYSQTFAGKQYTAMPEDAGLVGGSCSAYLASVACPPQVLLGQSVSGAWWGYFLGEGLCAQYGYPSTCSNWAVYKPMEFTAVGAGFGSFRLPNARAFNTYVDGRFYSDVFYSPNDRWAYEASAAVRDPGLDYESILGSNLAASSYCLSPAAMYHPGVLAAANGGYQDPNSFVEGYISPTVAQCSYPDLKTRMIEHNWNDGAPSMLDGPASTERPGWLFNASRLASPNGFFFDGHVARVSNDQAILDDDELYQTSGQRLWSRTTPFGTLGYGASTSMEAERTSHTILTVDGILGRDLLRH